MLAAPAGRIYDHAPQQNAVPVGRLTPLKPQDSISTSPVPADYGIAVVTYIDLLGFRALSAGRKAGTIARVIDRFQERGKPYLGATASGHSSVSFSDLIVRVAPYEASDSHGLRRAIEIEASDLASAQLELAGTGIVVRGAMTAGQIVADTQRIFGPALIRAYELESKVAVFPRIILDPDVAKRIGLASNGPASSFAIADNYFTNAPDGNLFLDYIRAACQGVQAAEADDEIPDELALLDNHAMVIERGLIATDSGVKAKYKWLDDYHQWSEDLLFPDGRS